MLKKLILLTGCLALAISGAFAQTTSCSQTLRLARSTYDQGRLHELPELLKNCLANGFSDADKVTALRLLTLSYIYLEEPEKADESMKQLLETDHFFQINEAVDPAEFVALYKTFRTTPVFSFGVKLGGSATFASVINNYPVGNLAAGNGKYGFSLGFLFGGTFENQLFANSKSDFLRRTIFAPEVFFSTRNLTYSNNNVFVPDSVEGVTVAKQSFVINQSWVDLNAIGIYKLVDDSKTENRDKLIPYVGLGPGVSFLLAAKNSDPKLEPVEGSNVSGPVIDNASSYHRFVLSVIGIAGARVRFGSFYVLGEIRYQYGISNVINPSKRTNAESVFDYATQMNDFRQSNATLNLGIVFPIFKPMKK